VNSFRPFDHAATRWLLAVLLTWGAYFLWMWSRMLYETEAGLFVGTAIVWADWVVHLGLSAVFAYREPGDWLAQNPLFLGQPMQYHFAVNLISGLLLRLGLGYQAAFIIPSIIASLAFIVVLFFFYRHILKRPSYAFFAVSFFFLNGGLGILIYLRYLADPSGIEPPDSATNLTSHGIHWISILVSEIFPQRALLLGLCLTLPFLFVVYRWVETHFRGIAAWHGVLLGAGSSFLLLVHAHSYMVFVFLCGVLFAYSARHIKHWLFIGFGAALTVVPLYLLLMRGGVGHGFFEWYPGWMANPKEKPSVGFFTFWFLNWGFFLPIAIWGTLRLRLYRNPLVVGGFGLFIIVNLVKIQPWIWDNTKVLTWAHLLLCIPVAAYLGYLWEHRGKIGIAAKSLAAVLGIVIVASGGFDAWRLAAGRHDYMLFSRQELTLANRLRDISVVNDVVLNGFDHHHWVTLTGRQQLMSYPGWLSSWGIDPQAREQDVRLIYRGDSAAQRLIDRYYIRYIVIGPKERELISPVNEDYFRDRYPVVLQEGNTKVYCVTRGKILDNTLGYHGECS
jgi:hypothetical protein